MKKLMLRDAAIPPGFSGKSNLPFFNFSTSINRCYAAFNFVADDSSEKRIPHGVPLEKFPTETALRHYSLSLSSQEVPVVQNHSAEDEDDFTELGLPVPEDGDAGSNLVTKMHKASLKVETSRQPVDTDLQWVRQLLSKMNFPQRENPSMKVSPKEDYHPLGSFFKLQKWFSEKGPNYKTPSFITIEEIPSSITLSELKEAVSFYGEISSASMRIAQNGSNSCDIEFENLDSMERALVGRHVTVRNCHLPIRSRSAPKVVTVRISNISVETAEPTIHSVCKGCGSVEGLLRTKEGAIEVLFSVKDSSVAQTILNKLNDVSINGCRWSAQLLSKTTPNSITNVADAQHGVGSQIINLIGGFRKQLEMKRIYLEDFEKLHQAVVHIRECPTDGHL
ncbi:uncharacterized protein LOC131225278 isoform X2 [Magnolia sinica]|uniref:uncharacterized protein LOC131225278 isoform X2 n=1 Tax=Magnolia sinica TaxID=86752 RepID=UPI002658F85B|nr:uncharacterized protein LOC131225278 isoform X2 [Magnolia sinica]